MHIEQVSAHVDFQYMSVIPGMSKGMINLRKMQKQAGAIGPHTGMILAIGLNGLIVMKDVVTGIVTGGETAKGSVTGSAAATGRGIGIVRMCVTGTKTAMETGGGQAETTKIGLVTGTADRGTGMKPTAADTTRGNGTTAAVVIVIVTTDIVSLEAVIVPMISDAAMMIEIQTGPGATIAAMIAAMIGREGTGMNWFWVGTSRGNEVEVPSSLR